MTLSEQIDADLKVALKSRQETRLSTLRMLKATMSNLAIQRQKSTLEDSEIQEVIQKLLKQHQESVEAYRKGNRPDLVEKETKEAEVLKAYLPPAMSEAQLKAIVQATLQELGVNGPAALGTVMKALMPKVKGRADGRLVNQLVNQMLQHS